MKERPKDRVVSAAILYNDVVYTLPAPARHHDVIRMMSEQGITDPHACREQGFVTELHRFVRRKPALLIAERAGQIIKKTNPLDTLFSEDVW